MKKEKVIIRPIPLHMVPVGETLAVAHCEDMGLIEGTPHYKEEYETYLHNFYDEAHGLSLTPSGLIGQNPSTPKVKEEFFRELDVIFGPNGLIANLKTDDYEKKKYDRVLRGNITSLAHFVLAKAYDLNLKRNSGKDSAFEYSKTATVEEKRETAQNQYLRLYYVIQIAKSLEEILTRAINSADSVSDIMEEAFGSENPVNNGTSEEGFHFLYDPENRIKFIRHFYKKSLKLSNPSKKLNPLSNTNSHGLNEMKKIQASMFYIDPENGYKFKKHEVDNIVKQNPNMIVEVTPRIEYLPEELRYVAVPTFADMTEVVVFGSVMKGNKKDNIVIRGIDQITRAYHLNLPTIDSIILDVETTKKLMC